MARSALINILISMIYSSIVVLVYHVEILRHFSHMKFEGARGMGISLVIAAVLAGLLAAALPRRQPSTATLILTFLHYLFFLPSAVFLAVARPTGEYILALALCYVVLNGISRLRLPILGQLVVPNSGLYISALAIVGATLVVYFWYGGIEVLNFDRKQVYQYRDLVAEMMPGTVGYLRSNAANVLIPFALVLALQSRSVWRVSLIALCALLLFGVSSHKSTIFTFGLVFASYWAICKEPASQRWGLLLLAVVGFCLLEVVIVNLVLGLDQPGVLTSHLVRRSLMVPPLLDSLWVEFFADRAKYFWSGSRLSMGLIEPPYELSAPRVIGSQVFGSKVMAANTGIIGSGYANLGLPGVALYSALLGLVIAYLDALGRKVGPALVAVISLGVIPKIAVSTDLTTALLTHGLLLLLVLVHFLPSSKAMARPSKGAPYSGPGA